MNKSMTRPGLWAMAGFLLLIGVGANPAPLRAEDKGKPAAFQVEPGVRQLFLDDVGVEKIDGLKRTMHQPVKRGAVLKPDQPWETVLQIRCAPAWDESKQVFKLWMVTSTPAPGVAGTTYAESKDGINWTKPILRQYEYQGSRENNFVTPDPKLHGPIPQIRSCSCGVTLFYRLML